MANRVEQIALHVRKLAQATGVDVQKKEFNEKDVGLDGVTSDLDIEALSKGLLDVSRDLDLYLQGLLQSPDLPVLKLKEDIAALERELQEKDELLEKSLDMVRKAEVHFRKVKHRQYRNVYQL